jgi:hypothetical protein
MKIEKLGWWIITFGLIIALVFTLTGNFIEFGSKLSPDNLSKYGGFIGGTVGILFSLAGYVLIYETLKTSKFKQFEDSFFTRFALFHEFRAKQIVLQHDGSLKYGTEFFTVLFYVQMNIKLGEKKTLKYYKDNLTIHKGQFSYYFGLFEMCLSSIYENNIHEEQKKKFLNFLDSMLSEQEQFIFCMFDEFMTKKSYPLVDEFKNRYSEIKEKTITTKTEGPSLLL